MKAIFGFLIGLVIGTYIIFWYLDKNRVGGEVLSQDISTTSTPAPTEIPTPEGGEMNLEITTPTPSPLPSEIPKTPSPTKVPRLTLKPTAKITLTPSLSPTATATATPTPETSVTPTRVPTLAPTYTPQPTYTSEQINGFIDRFAGQYGVDPNVLRFIAICESGFRANAINGPYAGLYQFSSGTWSTYRTQIGEDKNPDLRLNAEEAVQTAAYVLSIGKSYIWPNCIPK